MKICVLVPSEEHLKQGGVRIRYRRIQEHLQGLGDELQVIPLGELANARDYVHDIYIISKCYDAAAILLSVHLKSIGKLVGVDLFDDYFSQSYDSRFIRQRLWLRSLVPLADFILVSTPAMRDVVHDFAPGKPVHLMNDPSPPLDSGTIRAAVRHKLEKLDREKILNVGWFGIGDNPHFPVGLADLVAFGTELTRLRAQRWDIRLDILTNERAMTSDGLAMLRRLPLPWTVEVWTEDREADLLARSMVIFLPVNAQNFSIAKSLNRAVSALSAGAQVLSSGYPLYEPLSAFIYRNPAELRADVEMHRPALREETIGDFLQTMAQLGSAPEEARKLSEFLATQRKNEFDSGHRTGISQAVIHGKRSSGEVHKLAQEIGALSVASPFASQKLDYDVKFLFSRGLLGLDVLIAEKHCARLRPEVQNLLYTYGKEAGIYYRTIEFSHLVPGYLFTGEALVNTNSTFGMLASYAHVMNVVEKAIRSLFPGISCYYSEQSKIPFWTMHAA